MTEEQTFSGFATRQQESYYDKAIEKLICLLTERLLALYGGHDEGAFTHEAETKWVKQLRKLCKALQVMEKGAVKI